MRTLSFGLYHFARITAILLPLVVVGGFHLGGLWSFAGVMLIVPVYALFDTFMNKYGPENIDAPWLRSDKPLWIYTLLHIGVSVYILSTIRFMDSYIEILGVFLSMLLMYGSVGSLCTHEFLHRKTKLYKSTSYLLMIFSHMPHFRVWHLWGHHKLTASNLDHDSSYKNESIYAFFVRTITGTFKWCACFKRKRIELLKALLLQVTFNALVGVFFGFEALAFLIVLGIGVNFMVAQINYISHYGLKGSRSMKESVKAHHSWETGNLLTSSFVFNAGKHSDHHCKVSKKHSELEILGSPFVMPYSLPKMLIATMWPRFFFSKMNPRLEQAGQSIDLMQRSS